MSSIMRARSGLTRRSERLESIGVPLSSRRLLDLQCSGPDAPIVTPYRSPPRRLRTGGDARPSRESGFVPCPNSVLCRFDGTHVVTGLALLLTAAVTILLLPWRRAAPRRGNSGSRRRAPRHP